MAQPARIDIMDQARGHWPAVFSRIGLGPRALSGKHGPCPLCGGKDRFRFDNKGDNGTYICNQCGAGNGIKLVMRLKNIRFADAADLVRQHLGVPLYTSGYASCAPSKSASDKNNNDRMTNRAFAVSLWTEAVAIPGTQAQTYLAARGLPDVASPALRFHPKCRLSGVPGHTYAPAVLALATDKSGVPCGVTRTYLDGDQKAAWPDKDSDPMAQRRFLGDFPPGCAVRLAPPAGGRLAVAEGYETALAVTKLTGYPCWALLNTTLMKSWVPPSGLRKLIIGADNDAKYGGQAAAFHLAHTIACRNRAPEPDPQVSVHTPARTGTDWLDVLNER